MTACHLLGGETHKLKQTDVLKSSLILFKV